MSLPKFLNVRLGFGALLCAALLAVCVPAARPAGAQSAGNGSMLTEERLKAPGWWPTRDNRARNDYVGAAQCVSCHASYASAIDGTPMARAATRAAEAQSLRQHPRLSFAIGPYKYDIDSSTEKSLPQKSVMQVSGPGDSLSAVLLWAFGMGRIGQTYVYESKGHFYESHLTFYTEAQALDITPGHPRTVPPSVEEGAGRRLSTTETRRCFGCHTTASTTGTSTKSVRFDPQHMFLGVTCEACHGPGADHVAAAKSGMEQQFVEGTIRNPARLTPVESVDFCGACHRTWKDVVSDTPIRNGTLNVRFAPYRLENSRCWKKADARITCVACHDPHQPLAQDPAFYDSRCLQCHLAAGARQTVEHASGGLENAKQDGGEPKNIHDAKTACPVGVKLCVTCHMPKFRNPALHTRFTDHWIRIAAPGAPLPD